MKLISRLKHFKFTHWIYNLFHYKSLIHNKDSYRKYGLRKPIFSSLSSNDFPDKQSSAWLDLEDSAIVAPSKPGFELFNDEIQHQILSWSANGFITLKNFVSSERVDNINREIDRLIQNKKLEFTHDHKLMFANRISPVVNQLAKDEGLVNILSFILDREVVPFQTINFLNGSEQRAHSDSIHMTTYPLGYLIAVWIALEDISPQSGPLFYYPGSHRLPYLMNDQFNNGSSQLTLGKNNYKDYEDVMEEMIIRDNLSKAVFLAKKGDVFIWHANLIHGGTPVQSSDVTRKSMVIHYYANDVIKYHEITERPALLK